MVGTHKGMDLGSYRNPWKLIYHGLEEFLRFIAFEERNGASIRFREEFEDR